MKKTVMLIIGIVLITVYGQSILAEQVWPTYSTCLGGEGTDIAYGISVSDGEVHVTGICDTAIFRGGISLWAVRGVTRAYYGTSGDSPVTR